MTRWGARLAVLFVFLAGGLCGAASLQLYRLRIENRIFHAPDPMAQLVVYKLDRELSLTEAQKVAVRDAVHSSRDEMLSLKTDLMPHVTAIFERASGRVRAALTAPQQVKFDRIVEERRRLLQQIRGTAARP
ncbi:MAG: hypothetical protein ABIT01_02470 [Thermoanaerobaculia bacterium]